MFRFFTPCAIIKNMNKSHYARGFAPLAVIIIIVALVAAGVLVYQTVDITPITPAPEQAVQDNVTATNPSQNTEESQKTTSTYQNTEVGIRFEYPKEWALQTSVRSGDGLPTSDIKGMIGKVCRSQDGEFCFIQLFSPDYQFYGMDHAGDIGFRGVTDNDKKMLALLRPLAISYIEKEIAGRQAIDITYTYKDEAAVWNTRRIVFITNPDAKFTGLAFAVPIRSLNKNTQTPLPGSKEEKEQYIQEVSQRIKSGSLSAGDKDFLAGLNTILSTLSFTQ